MTRLRTLLACLLLLVPTLVLAATPADIPNLTLYAPTSDYGRMTTGQGLFSYPTAADDEIYTLRDQSPLAHALTAPSATTGRPFLRDSGTGSGALDCLNSTAQRYLTVGSSTASFDHILEGTGTILLKVRCNNTTAAATQYFLDSRNGSNLTKGFTLTRTTAEVFVFTVANGTAAILTLTSSTAILDTDWHELRIVVGIGANACTITQDGVVVATGTFGTPTTGPAGLNLRVGNSASSGTTPADGRIRELVICSTAISAADQTMWAAYDPALAQITAAKTHGLPALATAEPALIFNFGGTADRSVAYTDLAAATVAVTGDEVLAFKDVTGTYTWAPSGDARGPDLTRAGILGNRPFLNFHDQVDTAAFTNTGWAYNAGTSSGWTSIAVLVTPRQYGGMLAGTTTAVTNQHLALFNADANRQYIRRQTGPSWGMWGTNAGALFFDAGEVPPLVDVDILMWELYDDGAQKGRLWRNGVEIAADATYFFPTSLTSLSFGLASSAERFRGAVVWWGLIGGELAAGEAVAIDAALRAMFPVPSTAGTHTTTSRAAVHIAQASSQQGYTCDSAGNQYTTVSGVMRKWDADGNILITGDTGFPIVGQLHTGGICHYNGLIYRVDETGFGTPPNNGPYSISWHSSETLALVDFVEITEPAEASGICVDPKRNRLYICGYEGDATTRIYSYNLTTKAFVEEIAIAPIPTIQGITMREPYLYFQDNDSRIFRMHIDHPGERESMFEVASEYLGMGATHGSDLEYSPWNVGSNDMRVQIHDTPTNILHVDLNFDAPTMYQVSGLPGNGRGLGVGIGVGIGLGVLERPKLRVPDEFSLAP